MGTNFKKSIFEDHVQVGLVGWAQKVKKKKGLKASLGGDSTQGGSTEGGSHEGSSTAGVQMALGGFGRRGATPPPPPPSNEVQPADGS